MKYYVMHPNFKAFLKLLDKVQLVNYFGRWQYGAHEWVDSHKDATPFDTEAQARDKFTSPLCGIDIH